MNYIEALQLIATGPRPDGKWDRDREACRQLAAEALGFHNNVASMTTTTEALLQAREALERISRWHGEFPATGRTWDSGEPMSYAACYGSNGERDYMRGVAGAAIAAIDALPAGEPEIMSMALCEAHSVVLRVGQPYVFRPVGKCETCAKMAADAREAYGPNMGAAPTAQPAPRRYIADMEDTLRQIADALGVPHGQPEALIAAAHAAAQPAPQAAPAPLPLTDERIAYFARHAADRIPASNYEGRVLHAVRMAEATRGITATPAKEPAKGEGE